MFRCLDDQSSDNQVWTVTPRFSPIGVPYSGKFSLVQNFAKMPPDSSEEIFMVFIFTERMCDTLTTPLPVDSHAPHANRKKNDTERRSEEECATTAYSSFCMEAFAIMKVLAARFSLYYWKAYYTIRSGDDWYQVFQVHMLRTLSY